MTALLLPWGHALVAATYLLLALWQLRRWHLDVRQRALGAAFAATALWGLTVAATGPASLAAGLAESLRNLGWLTFMLVLLGFGGAQGRRPAIVAVYAVIAAVIVAQGVIDIVPARFVGSPRILEAFFFASLTFRMMAAIGALLLVHNLYGATAPDARWGIRGAVIALAAMWAWDLNLYTIAYLARQPSPELSALRGVLALALAVPFALAARRGDRWKMRLSRRMTFQSLSLMAIGAYLIMMVLVARLLDLFGGQRHGGASIALIVALSLAAAVLPSRRVRAWLKVKIAKHFFQHRFDYREEWIRFTATLGVPGEAALPLDRRAIKAIADIAESPGGLLLLPDEDGGLSSAARWHWPAIEAPARAADPGFARHLATSGRIIEFGTLRPSESGHAADSAELAVAPAWLLATPSAWAAVPLIHIDRLVGVVLLERPHVSRMLDWEDFDLLRIAGRQVASYLAEAHGAEALSDARRFDEFNRRFAFIIHDIKNLVSQLGLVARNAERHADNPAFRADMVATLHSSTAKMNDLLARLSQHNKARAEEARPLALRPFIEGIVAARGGLHPLRGDLRGDPIALADPARLEQALVHLIQNAVDASPKDEPVDLSVERRGMEAAVTVLDRGCGMSAEFVRTALFKPFASTKDGGFGVGAFEARSIVAGMGGRLEVESREGEGSRFTIFLPLAAEMAERRRA